MPACNFNYNYYIPQCYLAPLKAKDNICHLMTRSSKMFLMWLQLSIAMETTDGEKSAQFIAPLGRYYIFITASQHGDCSLRLFTHTCGILSNNF